MTTWSPTPVSTFWTDPENWVGDAVPADTATFADSTRTALRFPDGAAATIEDITFDVDASPYSVTITTLDKAPALTISGAGVQNLAAAMQSFIVTSKGTYNQPQLCFTGKATAGPATVSYYAGPEDLQTSYGGGTIMFRDTTSAGSAQFTVRTGALAPPDKTSSLGGTIAFKDQSTAATATFTLWGTLGKDGDTFGNVVFHDDASADRGTFTNQGGTVPGGDGGNTQFYDRSSAGSGIYLNHGASAYNPHMKWGAGNGGDVAFDGVATGSKGYFYNYPGTIHGANGGVTSFNNNPNFPDIPNPGAKAGHGTYFNHGGTTDYPGKGGHTEFTAVYGMATADHATIYNFGSSCDGGSTAGHTIFALKPPCDFYSDAGNATIWNFPGIAGGYTVFQVYGETHQDSAPTAGNALIHSMGSDDPALSGGSTEFRDNTRAGNARLFAHGGTGDGQGGVIEFADQARGDSCHITLLGNGVLDMTRHDGCLELATLTASPGDTRIVLGEAANLTLTGHLATTATTINFTFSLASGTNLKTDTPYPVLIAPNLSDFVAENFTANTMENLSPTFTIEGETLSVTYSPAS